MAIEHWNESVLDLIPGYREARKKLERERDQTEDAAWKETLGLCIGNIDYALEWMYHGGAPSRRRGIERPYSTTRSNVTEVRTWDPKWLEVYRSPHGWTGYQNASDADVADENSFRVEEAMRGLTKRERECFVLRHAFGMGEPEIARELHLSRRSVQTYLERAEAKIEKEKATNVFLASW